MQRIFEIAAAPASAANNPTVDRKVTCDVDAEQKLKSDVAAVPEVGSGVAAADRKDFSDVPNNGKGMVDKLVNPFDFNLDPGSIHDILRPTISITIVPDEPSKSANNWLAESKRFYALKDFKKAIECVARGLSVEPQNPYLLHVKSNCLIQLYRFQEAISYIDLACNLYLKKHYPNQPNALDRTLIAFLHSKASAHIFLGEYDKAKTCCRKIFEKDQTIHLSWHIYADIFFFQQNYVEAIKHYDKVLTMQPMIATDPEWLKSCFCLGFAYLKTNDYTRAKLRFNQILIRDPDNRRALYYMGMCHVYEKNFESALDCFDTLINLIPEKVEIQHRNSAAIIWNNKAVAHFCFGELNEALKCLKYALALNPNYSLAKDNLSLFSKIENEQKATSLKKAPAGNLSERSDEKTEAEGFATAQTKAASTTTFTLAYTATLSAAGDFNSAVTANGVHHNGVHNNCLHITISPVKSTGVDIATMITTGSVGKKVVVPTTVTTSAAAGGGGGDKPNSPNPAPSTRSKIMA